ncbi:M24 family metallopeptidase [Aeromicrobium sp.]|uniref:M24 family metallopeptidase n=1 Tax=Aeromicrobium sp. TaxID=1871063 RepID=UPI003D6B7757
MPDVHADRRSRLAENLQQRELDAALISDLVNLRYLTGFTGSNGAVLVTAAAVATFVSDGRYRDQATAECPDVDRHTDRDLFGTLLTHAELPGDARIGVETHALSVDEYETVVGLMGERAFSASSLRRAVEELRVVKDDVEITALARACEISTQALAGLLDGPFAGRTEREIARDLEWRMFEHGAEAVGFDTIVASGPNAAIPHHSPGDRRLEGGDLLKIDFGARYDGYHADCTRTMVLGPPADWQREIHAAVRDAQQAGVDALVAGKPVADADTIPRDVLDEAGYLEAFTTGIGHGVGLMIHEDPFIRKENTGTLLARTPLTMEPGIYLPGRGGVRIEDTLVVEHGDPTVLTTATKDLVELG